MPNPKTSSGRLGGVQGMNYQDTRENHEWYGVVRGSTYVPNPKQVSTRTKNSHVVSLVLILKSTRRRDRHEYWGAQPGVPSLWR